MTVWRVLHKAGIKKIKPMQKPGLAKEERLIFCYYHEH